MDAGEGPGALCGLPGPCYNSGQARKTHAQCAGKAGAFLLAFIVTAVLVSLSGVMAPGPMTTAALAAGARNRHAGAVMGLGHALVELPLIALLAGGAGALMDARGVRSGIGLVGGAFLLFMGLQLLRSMNKTQDEARAPVQRHPFWVGSVLTCANPYFLLWWATVGLTLATRAFEFGLVALAVFTIAHSLCDIGWLEVLSQASFKGTQVMGARSQKTISLVCGVALAGFGVKFIYDAGAGVVQGLTGG